MTQRITSRVSTKVYFIFQDPDGQQKIFEIDPKFVWDRRFEVRDQKGYRFYLPSEIGIQTNLALPPESELLDMRVDKNGVTRYRFQHGSDLQQRISNNILSHSEEDPDWWLLTKPGMLPLIPLQNTNAIGSQNSTNPISNSNSTPVFDLTDPNTRVPTIARIGFIRSTTTQLINRIEIVYF